MQKPNFRLGNSSDTAFDLKKTIELQLLYVSSLFDPLQKEPGQAIHETRQTCKKCRAILRLMRDSMGYAAYFRENRTVRDLQRELARVRDADVQQHLFSQLAEQYPEYTGKPWYSGLLEKAKEQYDLELNRFHQGGIAVQISERFRTAAERIKTYELNGEGFGMIHKGLFRIYRQGRDMGNMVFSETADEHIAHSLRKKAKYLQHQISYLGGINSTLFTAMSGTIEQLTENLGYYNDLSLSCRMLQEYAEESNLPRKDYRLFLGTLKEEMKQVKTDSSPIYVNVYAEPAGAFIRRIGTNWESRYLRSREGDRNRMT